MEEAPESVVNKAAFGELTLGEVWNLVGKKTHFILVEGEVFKWGPYSSFRFTPNSRLEVSDIGSESGDDWEQDFSFDLGTKVAVKRDCVEFLYTDRWGEEEKIVLYFLFQPEPQPISMEFILPGGRS